MRSARKSFSNAKSKPNSRVAALIEEEARQRLLDSLIPSAGTLLVIPPVLMEHWQVRCFVQMRFWLVLPTYVFKLIPSFMALHLSDSNQATC